MSLVHAALDGDTVIVVNYCYCTLRKLMVSSVSAKSLINYQDACGATPLYCAAHNGHAAVSEQLIEARCTVVFRDIQNHDF